MRQVENESAAKFRIVRLLRVQMICFLGYTNPTECNKLFVTYPNTVLVTPSIVILKFNALLTRYDYCGVAMPVVSPVEAQFAAYHAHDIEAFDACFAEDFKG